jgi:hypothetical protein
VTDPWARPTGNPPAVEIELTGDEPAPSRAAARRDGVEAPVRPPSRRRRVGLALGGAVLAIGVAAAVTTVGDGDESSGPPTTTFDASRVTTPPTLPELTLPPATDPDEPSLPDDDGALGPVPAAPQFDPTSLTVPSFDDVPGVAPGELAGYDLLGAIAANSIGGTPMRTKLRLDGIEGSGSYRTAFDVTASNDPAAGIDSIVIQGNVGERAEVMFDRTGQSVFRTDFGMDGRWEQLPIDAFVVGTGTDVVDTLFDAFATGPISAAAVAAATVEPADGLVRLNGGAIARQYRVTVPNDALQPYGILLLAGIDDGAVDDGRAPVSITFDVYVTDQPALALVAARFESDGTVYLLQQFFDRRPANVLLELPPPDAVIDGEVTGAPGRVPTTEPPTSVPPTSVPPTSSTG